MELSIALFVFQMACANGAFGNDCDSDVWCMSWKNMYACHERYFGDIHTLAYMETLKRGSNPKPRIENPEAKPARRHQQYQLRFVP